MPRPSNRTHSRHQRLRRFETLESRNLLATLVNPSFESPDIGNFQENNPATGWTGGPVALPGAHANAGPGVVQNGGSYGAPTAPNGTQAALLKSSAYMEQEISDFVVGTEYSLSYWTAPRGTQSNNVVVSIGGTEIDNYTVPGSSAYAKRTITFVATAETMTLRFETTIAPGDQSIFLDHIELDNGPSADASGPYVIGFGDAVNQSITLDASASVDPDGNPITLYSWDLDGDEDFDDAVGVSPTLTADDLAGFGISAAGTYPIALKVTANGLESAVATSTIQVSHTVIDDDGNLNVYGTSGNDRIILSFSAGIQVRLNNKLLGKFDTIDKVIVHGQQGNDTITGSGSFAVKMEVYGGEGNDYVASGSASDTLVGGSGNDRLLAGAGDDLLYGGDDSVEATDSGNDTLAGGLGIDTIYGGDGVDNISGDAGDDLLFGEAGNDRLFGLAGNDIIRGGDGVNHIDGGAGHDILVGGSMVDKIYGQAGRDLILGGAGNDSLYGGNDTDLIVADESDSDTKEDIDLQEILDLLATDGDTGDYSTYFNSSTILSYSADSIYGQAAADVVFHTTLDKLLSKTVGDIYTDLEI